MWKYQSTDSMYDTLMHHGIRGMKWGIRRYQNKDGSLTAAGRRRQRNNPFFIRKSKAKKENANKQNNQNKKVKKVKKTTKEMTNEELKEKTNRMRLENDYIRTSQDYAKLHQKQASLGKRFIQSLGKDVIIPAFKDAGKNAVSAYLSKEFKNALGLSNKDTKKILKGVKK